MGALFSGVVVDVTVTGFGVSLVAVRYREPTTSSGFLVTEEPVVVPELLAVVEAGLR